MLTRYGPVVLAERAMPQLARWEYRFGWTRTGFGAVSDGLRADVRADGPLVELQGDVPQVEPRGIASSVEPQSVALAESDGDESEADESSRTSQFRAVRVDRVDRTRLAVLATVHLADRAELEPALQQQLLGEVQAEARELQRELAAFQQNVGGVVAGRGGRGVGLRGVRNRR
ncbi:hypothetical protein ACWCQW_55445 [Streptomyces mirabilis]